MSFIILFYETENETKESKFQKNKLLQAPNFTQICYYPMFLQKSP